MKRPWGPSLPRGRVMPGARSLASAFVIAASTSACSASEHLSTPIDAVGPPCVGTLAACGVEAPEGLEEVHRAASDWHVSRFEIEARAGREVLVEGELNLQFVTVEGVRPASSRTSAARIGAPIFVPFPDSMSRSSVRVARRAFPSRAVWDYQLRVGSPEATASFVTNRVVSTSVIAMWAFVVAALQLVYATSTRNRAGALAVSAFAAVQGVRATAMQYHWASWWSGAPSLAYALELATLPLGQIAIARFYGWVAGVEFRSPLQRTREVALVALATLASLGLAFPAVWLTTLRLAQVGVVVTVITLVATVRRIVDRADPQEKRLVLVGFLAQAFGVAVDLAVALQNGPLFLGIGFAGLGFIVETLMQTAVVAARNSRAHDRIEELASELEAKNARIEATNLELKRLDKLKDEFLANTSHELRTPLHGILGLTESVCVAEPGLGERSRARLEMVLASGNRLMSLVNDLLDFSRLQHGALELREKDLPLRQAVNIVLAVLATLAESKGLELVNDVPEALTVRADEARLQQILTNLIGNAVKFTLEGRVSVRASVEGGRVTVRVQDTGIGIAEESLGRIFESFVQGDGSTARQFGGTGLGLTVSQKLVAIHGGTLQVASEVGVGSTFSFDLALATGELAGSPQVDSMVLCASSLGSAALLAVRPRQEARPTPTTNALKESARPPEQAAVAPGSLGRLLVADDDPVNIEVLRAQLEPQGYDVVPVRDGQEAVETLEREGPFDGVLLDVMMPRLTGPEAAARIREQYPLGTLPIVMLTAKTRPEDVVIGLRAGANDYLSKPFHRDELSTRLDVHLDATRTMKASQRLIRPTLALLAGAGDFAELRAGHGRMRSLLLMRVTIAGLERLSSRHDEGTLFAQIGAVVRIIANEGEGAGGVLEAMNDDSLSILFDASKAEDVLDLVRILPDRVAARLPPGVRLAIVIHAGPVHVGALGTEEWLAVRALGSTSLMTAALGRWAVDHHFSVVITDAVVAKFEQRDDLRRLGTARLADSGQAATVFEILAPSAEALDCGPAIDALERGRFEEVLASLHDVPQEDHLVSLLRASADARVSEHLLR